MLQQNPRSLNQLKGENKPKPTLQGVAIALLHYGILRGTKVAMITVEDVSITIIGSLNQIENYILA